MYDVYASFNKYAFELIINKTKIKNFFIQELEKIYLLKSKN